MDHLRRIVLVAKTHIFTNKNNKEVVNVNAKITNMKIANKENARIVTFRAELVLGINLLIA